MRPKKKILLASESEDRASELRFMLRTNRYDVTSVSTLQAARDQLAARQFEILIVDLPFTEAHALVAEAAIIDRDLRTVALAGKAIQFEALGDPEAFVVDARMLRQRNSADLLCRLYVLAARKRGPKKKPVATVNPQDYAAELVGIA